MKKYKTIFLDADDTVFDFDKAQHAALKATFDKLGYPFTEKTYKIYDKINIKNWKLLEQGETTKEKLVFDRFIELYETTGINGDVAATEDEYQKRLGDYAFWWQGAKDGVKYLAEKYEVFVTTNGHADTQLSRAKLSGLDKIVNGIFVSEAVGAAKPAEEYFDYCINKSGADRETTLIIGDSLSSDITGGIQARIDTMWFNPTDAPMPFLPITYVVKSWQEIKQIL